MDGGGGGQEGWESQSQTGIDIENQYRFCHPASSPNHCRTHLCMDSKSPGSCVLTSAASPPVAQVRIISQEQKAQSSCRGSALRGFILPIRQQAHCSEQWLIGSLSRLCAIERWDFGVTGLSPDLWAPTVWGIWGWKLWKHGRTRLRETGRSEPIWQITKT